MIDWGEEAIRCGFLSEDDMVRWLRGNWTFQSPEIKEPIKTRTKGESPWFHFLTKVGLEIIKGTATVLKHALRGITVLGRILIEGIFWWVLFAFVLFLIF